MSRGFTFLAAALGGTAMLTAFTQPADARVTRLEIVSSTPAYDGRSFGAVGAYERIDAIAHFTVDPASPRGEKIVDLSLAPVNADGEVEFSAEIVILRPLDQDAAAPVLFYDVPNRGRNLVYTLLNRSGMPPLTAFTIDDPGDGFLMERGYTIVWGGWQTGLPEDLLTIDLPVIEDLVDMSREEFIFDRESETETVELSYPAADLDPEQATLTVRRHATDERETAEGLDFRYVDARTIEITRPEGYDAGAIYEFIYPATDAVPAGLAFAATSDLVSFLRGSPGHDAESPLAGIEHTIAVGISQSGRFLRDLIYQGFNVDEAGEKVFDGAIPHIAGSRKTFTNARFAQPGRYSRHHEDHDYPGDQFPFTYAQTANPEDGGEESILSACSETDTCPLVIHTDTSGEYWQARASLLSTTPEGEPVTLPDTVRLYMLSGAPHFSAWGTQPSPSPVCVNDANPLSVAPTMRALVTAMEAWVRDGTPPPDSRYPTVADGTLVAADTLELPQVDGVDWQPRPNELVARDHTSMPPTASDVSYAVMVPSVDADGIPRGGIAEALVAAPLGSYFGWNLRKENFAAGALCGLTGSFVPFPVTEAEGDSRASIESRYGDRAAYVEAVREAAADLVADGFMLEADIDYILEAAEAAFPESD